MSKNEKLSGAANRINRALQHRLSSLSCLLCQLENERAAGQALFGGDFDPQSLINLKGRDAESDSLYRGHDRDICAMVSGALGHNRLSVVFEHYIR